MLRESQFWGSITLHLAGSYLKLFAAEITLPRCLNELRRDTPLAHESLQGLDAGISPTAHDWHVARTFALSYKQLQRSDLTDHLALALLARAARFASGQPIPRDLLLKTVEVPDPAARRLAVRALERLGALGLLERDNTATVRLHRLLAAFVLVTVADVAAQIAVEQALIASTYKLSWQGYSIEKPPLEVHLRHVVDAARGRTDMRVAELCNGMAYHLAEFGDLQSARPYYERALSISKLVLGAEHPKTARLLSDVGSLLQKAGDLTGARSYLAQALPTLERVLGPHHDETRRIRATLEKPGDLALMIVEDELDLLRILYRLILDIAIGYPIITAYSGAEALKHINQLQIPLVITNHRMSGMNGVELTKAIKNRSPNTCVVLTTADATPQLKEQATMVGVSYFFARPFPLEEFTEIIWKSLGK